MESTRAIQEFCIQCNNGVATYRHIPGPYSWRYITNLCKSGSVEAVQSGLDLSTYLSIESVGLLEKIFCAGQVLREVLSATARVPIYNTRDCNGFNLLLRHGDLSLIAELVECATVLDMRYDDYESITAESEAATQYLTDLASPTETKKPSKPSYFLQSFGGLALANAQSQPTGYTYASLVSHNATPVAFTISEQLARGYLPIIISQMITKGATVRSSGVFEMDAHTKLRMCTVLSDPNQ